MYAKFRRQTFVLCYHPSIIFSSRLSGRPTGEVDFAGHLSVGLARPEFRDDCNTLCITSKAISMTTFQPRPGDACTWVAEAAFYDFDDELEEQDLSLQDLQAGYEILHKAFTEANISFAAIGGFVFSIMGGREDLTHDVDFQINTTPVELFSKLRTIKKYVFHSSLGVCLNTLIFNFFPLARLRLKIGLQADNFRVHCNIGADKWVGVDMLMTSKP